MVLINIKKIVVSNDPNKRRNKLTTLHSQIEKQMTPQEAEDIVRNDYKKEVLTKIKL